MSEAGITSAAFETQWKNPANVLSVLLVIGGDIVQTALAQTSGGLFTPVCFSFGWVAYSFKALVNVVGEGRLLPQPDYPAKVINLESGYKRENRNWVIGRLLRDNASFIAKDYAFQSSAIRIFIYKALPRPKTSFWRSINTVQIVGVIIMILQLGIASIPAALDQQYGILMITTAGTLLVLIAGWLPQWKAEKMPNRQNTTKSIAVTGGNGFRDIMIIQSDGEGLDLEELATSESPRAGRPWEKKWIFSRPERDQTGNELYYRDNTPIRHAIFFRKFPVGFLVTRMIVVVESICWLALLVTVAALKSDTWYLLGVGGIGMFQNAILAAIERSPEDRRLPIRFIDRIITNKVMDGLMDLEVSYPGYGPPLLNEYFPGELRPDEKAWWQGNRTEYDNKRCSEQEKRGIPRSIHPTAQPSSLLQQVASTVVDNRPSRLDNHEAQTISSLPERPRTPLVVSVASPQSGIPVIAEPCNEGTTPISARTASPPEHRSRNDSTDGSGFEGMFDDHYRRGAIRSPDWA